MHLRSIPFFCTYIFNLPLWSKKHAYGYLRSTLSVQSPKEKVRTADPLRFSCTRKACFPSPSLSFLRTRKEKEGAAGVHRRCKTLIMTQGFASSYHQLYLRCNILLTTQGTSQWSAHHATYPLGACVTNRQVGYSQIILLSSYRQYL